MTTKLTRNLILIAIIVGIFLIAGIIIFGTQNGLQEKAKGLSSQERQEIAEKTLNYINENLLGGRVTASLVEVTEEYGLVKLTIEMGGIEIDSYVTPDGKLFFPEAFNLEEELIVQESDGETSEPSTEITLSPEDLEKFIACLKKADFVIYGANWCGWTKKLVTMLGGWEMIKPIYVECTEESELCNEKGIQGYPTILVKGEEYQESRTFEDFGVATNCEILSGAESITGGSSSGDCQ